MANQKKKGNATRRLLFIAGGLVILLVILGVIGNATGLLGEHDNSVQVEVTDAEIRDITQVVTASGKVQPEVEVKISPDVSGEIIELNVQEGDHVKRGDLLVRIKPDFYKAQVEQQQAGVLQAKATISQRKADLLTAQNELKRQKELLDKNAISQRDFEQAENNEKIAQAAYEAAEYSLQSAEARLRESNENLAKTTIYAPMDGTISVLNVEPGERVVGTSQMAGTEMMRIARLDQMELEVDVNENDVVNVAVGDTAAIEVDAYPDRKFNGVVTEIANSARVTGAGTQEQVTNFPVKVRVLDVHNLAAVEAEADGQVKNEEVPIASAEAPNFRPGMSGTVDIYTKTVFDGVAIPIQAVTVRDFNKMGKDGMAASPAAEREGETVAAAKKEDLRKVVFVAEADTARMVEVETGIADDTHIQIVAGLSGGEQVVTGPFRVVSRTLNQGDRVKVKNQTPVPNATLVASQ